MHKNSGTFYNGVVVLVSAHQLCSFFNLLVISFIILLFETGKEGNTRKNNARKCILIFSSNINYLCSNRVDRLIFWLYHMLYIVYLKEAKVEL